MADSLQQILANEAELVEKAKSDDTAFEILYNFYFPRIYGYIYKRVGRREEAEDIVSTTFLKVFCNMKKYQARGFSFGAWVYKVATNNLIDYYRHAGRRLEASYDDKFDNDETQQSVGPIDPGDNPEVETDRNLDKTLVHKALKDLPDKDQRILHLKYFAELSSEEIALALQTSENNVRVLSHRALKKFHTTYKKYAR